MAPPENPADPSQQPLDPKQIAPEEYPAILAVYQQRLADEQLTNAALTIKLQRAQARLQFAYEDLSKAMQRTPDDDGSEPDVADDQEEEKTP